MRKGLALAPVLLAGSLMAASPAPATAQTMEDPLILKGQSSHPAAANLHLLFQLWGETVDKMSGGRIKVETLPAGAIVPAFEVFDAVSRHVLDVGIAPFGYILGKSLAGIPLSHGPVFGMDGTDYWAWYYDGGGMALLDEFYRDVLKMNIVAFPVPTDYPQGLGWFKEPISSLDDLQGMKYRIYGIGAETYGRLGVSVVTIPGGEIVPAMERGVIDGAEWINCAEDQKLGLQDVANHYYTPGMHEPVTGGQVLINGDVWNELTPDLQEIIKVATVYATVQRNFILNRETAVACQELIAQGVTLHRTPDDILLSFLEEWEEIQAEYAADDPFYKKVVDSQRDYAEVIVPFRLSWFPPYEFAGKFYWNDQIYLDTAAAQ
jgi:TRAP-type mannitol/chloroaromatic compound transport system substrate-binding protein